LWFHFFSQVTEEQIASYEIALVVACGSNDINTVKSLHAGQINKCLQSLWQVALAHGMPLWICVTTW
jgi:hypothetical protein